LGAEKIEVDISANGEKLTVDATKFSLRDFKFDNVAVDELAKVDKLAELIADALCGKGHLIVTVEAYAMIGKGQDVYPSEEMILDKLKEEKPAGGRCRTEPEQRSRKA
jgi:CRISPR-associated protein Csy3